MVAKRATVTPAANWLSQPDRSGQNGLRFRHWPGGRSLTNAAGSTNCLPVVASTVGRSESGATSGGRTEHVGYCHALALVIAPQAGTLPPRRGLARSIAVRLVSFAVAPAACRR